MAYNRELSQFASFIEVGISSIGITTSVGIAKTNPQYTLDVNGDINFTGTFYQGGSQFIASRWSATGSDIYRISRVGINTSIIPSTLTVAGDGSISGVVTATTFNGQINAGVGTVTILSGTTANYAGIATVGSLNVGATQVISSGRQLQNIASLDATTTATIESAIANSPNTFTDLSVSGVGTFSNGPVLIGSGTSTGTATQRLQVTGGAYISNSVGIGTNNPITELQVVGRTLLSSSSTYANSTAAISVYNGSASANYYKADNHYFQLASGTGVFTSDSAGRLLIGQTINGSGTIVQIQGSGGSAGDLSLDSNASTASIQSYNSKPLYINALGNNIAILRDGGSLGIGTVNPADKLHLQGIFRIDRQLAAQDQSYIRYFRQGTEKARFGLLSSDNAIYFNATNNDSANHLVINSSGNVLLGTASATGTASQPLQVTGGAYVSGSIGMGTTNPIEKLQVIGRILSSSAIRAGTTAAIASSGELLSVLGQATIRLDSSTSAVTYLINADTTASTIQPFLFCNDAGGNRAGIGVEYSSAIASFYGHQGISLQTGSTAFGYANDRVRITSTGNVGINTTNPQARLSIGSVSGFHDTTTTVATTSTTTIDSFSATVFRSAKVQIQITQGSNYQASDILVIHDGTTADLIEYGSIATNDYLGSFTATVSGGNCLLRINMNSGTSATVKVLSQRVTI